MISNSIVYDLSEAVLIHLFMTKKKNCFDKSTKSVMPGCHHSTSVVIGNQSAGQMLRAPLGGYQY